MIGPKHYDGWTCKDCENVYFCDFHEKYYCKEVGSPLDYMNNYETPNWCPYIRSAIIERNVEEI